MPKAISWPSNVSGLTDHEPYFEHGSNVLLEIYTDGVRTFTCPLTVRYYGEKLPNVHHDWFLWCEPTTRVIELDSRVHVLAGLDPTKKYTFRLEQQ